jgi:hypothetical protein
VGALTTIVEQQVIEYCLEILDEVKEKIQGEVSLASLEAALNQMGNTVYCRVGAGEGPAFELKKHLWPIKCL